MPRPVQVCLGRTSDETGAKPGHTVHSGVLPSEWSSDKWLMMTLDERATVRQVPQASTLAQPRSVKHCLGMLILGKPSTALLDGGSKTLGHQDAKGMVGILQLRSLQ